LNICIFDCTVDAVCSRTQCTIFAIAVTSQTFQIFKNLCVCYICCIFGLGTFCPGVVSKSFILQNYTVSFVDGVCKVVAIIGVRLAFSMLALQTGGQVQQLVTVEISRVTDSNRGCKCGCSQAQNQSQCQEDRY
jgi:hypothetical protein